VVEVALLPERKDMSTFSCFHEQAIQLITDAHG